MMTMTMMIKQGSENLRTSSFIVVVIAIVIISHPHHDH
jgi:hypothetical protein